PRQVASRSRPRQVIAACPTTTTRSAIPSLRARTVPTRPASCRSRGGLYHERRFFALRFLGRRREGAAPRRKGRARIRKEESPSCVLPGLSLRLGAAPTPRSGRRRPLTAVLGEVRGDVGHRYEAWDDVRVDVHAEVVADLEADVHQVERVDA